MSSSSDRSPPAHASLGSRLAALADAGQGVDTQGHPSEQTRFFEKTRRNFEAVSKRHGPTHSLTQFWSLECRREAGFLISGAYCSGVSGWGRA